MLNFSRWCKIERQAILSCLKTIRQQPLMTMITSIMIGFILTWPTFLWVLSEQAKHAIDEWHQQAFFTFYLSNTVNEQTKDDIMQRLKSMQDIKDIRVISPEQSLKRLLKNKDAESISHLGLDNPLPYVLEIQPNMQNFSANSLQDFYQRISQIPNLQGSKNNLNWFERLTALEHFLNRFTLLLIIVLMIGVSFLVSNTLRMVIHSRYEEIQVLKLIGATHQYILSPFLYTGAMYGFLGSLFAILTVDVSIGYLQQYFKPLAELYDYVGQIHLIAFAQMILIIFASLSLGWLAAWIFVRQSLNRIEPVK